MSRKKRTIIAAIAIATIIIIAVGMYVWRVKSEPDPGNNEPQTAQQDAEQAVDSQPVDPQDTDIDQAPTPPPPANTTPPSMSTQWPVQISISDAASLTVIVNKKHQLPSNYAPALNSNGKLRDESNMALNNLAQAASNSGISVIYVSGYRSYSKQEQLYNNYVAQDGQAAADTYSARPGHSEHQTGLAVDVGDGNNSDACPDLEICYGDTASGKWVATNAHKYGFVVRYPKGKEAITGYQYEPWHLRYIGVSEATAIYNSDKTLEEYYNVTGGDYQ